MGASFLGDRSRNGSVSFRFLETTVEVEAIKLRCEGFYSLHCNSRRHIKSQTSCKNERPFDEDICRIFGSVVSGVIFGSRRAAGRRRRSFRPAALITGAPRSGKCRVRGRLRHKLIGERRRRSFSKCSARNPDHGSAACAGDCDTNP